MLCNRVNHSTLPQEYHANSVRSRVKALCKYTNLFILFVLWVLLEPTLTSGSGWKRKPLGKRRFISMGGCTSTVVGLSSACFRNISLNETMTQGWEKSVFRRVLSTPVFPKKKLELFYRHNWGAPAGLKPQCAMWLAVFHLWIFNEEGAVVGKNRCKEEAENYCRFRRRWQELGTGITRRVGRTGWTHVQMRQNEQICG